MIDEEKLMAFADGELHGAERAAVEQALETDAALRGRLEAQRRLRATLSGHYGPVAGEEVPERLLALLGAAKPENVPSLSAARERRKPIRRPAWRNLGAIAATLAVGIVAGQLVPSSAPIGVEDGRLVAQGELAAALETQLASAQTPETATRIGITFADRQGRACRTFDAAAASGLACREDGTWSVLMTGPGRNAAATEYRQAGSPLVLQAAQEMMAGEPLDAAGERAAIDAGWKISGSTD